MRSVRCDVCGTKALMAASKCPKCGHAFEVRDGFGELLPLAHCSTCDSYYPESLGSCRWCGTKPDRAASIGPYIWKGFGILTFAALAIGAWLVHNESPSAPGAPKRTFVADTLPTNQPKTESVGARRTLAARDSVGAPPGDSVVAATLPADSTRQADSVATADAEGASSTTVVPPAISRAPIQSAGTVAQSEPLPRSDSSAVAPPEPAPVVAPSVASARRPPERNLSRPSDRGDRRDLPERSAGSTRVTERARAKTPPRAVAKATDRAAGRRSSSSRSATVAPPRVVAKAPARAAASKSTARSRSDARWVTSIAKNWAVVRANPSRQGRIIAAIGPNTRVQLGETRGEWRRVRAKGLSGWVEHRTLLASAPVSRKTGRLASR